MPRAGRSRRTKAARQPGAPKEEVNAASVAPTLNRFWLVAAGLVMVLGIAVRAFQLSADPRVAFLRDEGEAEWIRARAPLLLASYRPTELVTLFEHSFSTNAPTSDARLVVHAFRQAAVSLDGVMLDPGVLDPNDWKNARRIALPTPLTAGPHVLRIAVTNQDAYPCLLAYCEELGLHTGDGWQAAHLGAPFAAAIPAADLHAPELAGQYPTAWQAFSKIAPWLAGVFLAVFFWSLWNDRPSDRRPNLPRLRVSADWARGLLIAAWVVLAANNIWRLPSDIGFDIQGHYEYVEYIAKNHSLPLAPSGWQMFQPPLFYVLAAPCYAFLHPHYGDDVILKALRFLPLLCGLAQIEIAYRAARAVFPGKDDLQVIAGTVGGLLPMQIYIAQVIGNEPLAGCLTASVMLMCFVLLAEPTRQRSRWFFVLLGFLWGLALLSKVTALLLTPLLVGVVLWHSWQTAKVPARGGPAVASGLTRLGWVFGICALTAGWFFARNWSQLGKPVIGGGELAAGFHWWQDPSYRTWGQLTSFGSSLARPVYSGCLSLWDSLYSSMWLDGFISGTTFSPDRAPWNLLWMSAGAWLALVTTTLMLSGVLNIRRREMSAARPALVLAVAAIAVYVAAIADLYVRLPIYSTAKATYTVGLVPCYAVLAAAGAAPLLRFRVLRAALFSALACWAVAAYAAYFLV
jgi:hypothetical protein